IATVVVLFFMCFGFFWAILYRRVSIAQLWAVIIGVIAVLLGVVALVTMNDGWVTVGRWFMRQTAFSLAGWGLLPVIALGGVNYSLIRKATVRGESSDSHGVVIEIVCDGSVFGVRNLDKGNLSRLWITFAFGVELSTKIKTHPYHVLCI